MESLKLHINIHNLIYVDITIPLSKQLKRMTETYSDIRKQNIIMNLRMREFNKIRSKLKSDIETQRKPSRQYNRFYNALHSVAVGFTGVNATVARA